MVPVTQTRRLFHAPDGLAVNLFPVSVRRATGYLTAIPNHELTKSRLMQISREFQANDRLSISSIDL